MTRTRWVILLVLVYPCWLGMMAVHEAGHVLHARVSGGVVDRVSIPLAGFSLTTYSDNPSPHFVAWGGPIWGCAVPLMLLAALAPVRRRAHTIFSAAQFFTGFCLIANGVYLGVGWTSRAGDAGDLMRHGTPVWALVAFGIVAASSGLYIWHRMGRDPANARRPGASEDPDQTARSQSDPGLR